MNWKFMYGRAFGGAIRVCPFLKGIGARMNNLIGIGTGEIRGEGDVEGYGVHAIALIQSLQGSRRQRTLDRRMYGMGVTVQVLAPHPEGRGGHLLPAMASLAGEVAQLLHFESSRGQSSNTESGVRLWLTLQGNAHEE